MYGLFGSGSHHAPYAIIQKYSKLHNDGLNIGLIRASDTRMGGHFIAFLRFLRLKSAIQSTVMSVEFKKLKVGLGIAKLLQMDKLWDQFTILVKAVYPILKVLRLADKKSPSMDQLLYYVRMTDKAIRKSITELNHFMTDVDVVQDGPSVTTQVIQYLLGSTSASSWVIEEVEEEDGDNADNDSDASEGGSIIDEFAEEDDSDDDDSDDDDSYKDEDDEMEEGMGKTVLQAWKRRRKALVSDYAITAWMLSPIPEVMMDVHINHKGKHRDACERLLKKLYWHESNSNEVMNKQIDKFWSEFEHFQGKTGPYAHREHIWNSVDIHEGKSHIWHKKNTLRYTKMLGRFACRVTSKILGIGSAERSWGDVKHLKTNKRSHLSAESVKMQATIFGASCAERAAMKRKKRMEDPDSKADNFWRDDDFLDVSFLSTNASATASTKPTRIFRAWIEDGWEREAIRKKDVVHEAQLLKKYEGLAWHDPDTDMMFTADASKMTWSKRTRGNPSGYCVVGLREDYDPTDPGNDDTWEPWALEDGCPVHELIVKYYKLHPQEGLQVLTKDTDDGLFSDAEED